MSSEAIKLTETRMDKDKAYSKTNPDNLEL